MSWNTLNVVTKYPPPYFPELLRCLPSSLLDTGHLQSVFVCVFCKTIILKASNLKSLSICVIFCHHHHSQESEHIHESPKCPRPLHPSHATTNLPCHSGSMRDCKFYLKESRSRYLFCGLSFLTQKNCSEVRYVVVYINR